jgi:hypothetical protein
LFYERKNVRTDSRTTFKPKLSYTIFITHKKCLIVPPHHKNRGIRLILLQKCNCHGCRFDRGVRARRIFFLGPCNSDNLHKKHQHRMWWWLWLRQHHILDTSMARGMSIVSHLLVYFFHFPEQVRKTECKVEEG